MKPYPAAALVRRVLRPGALLGGMVILVGAASLVAQPARPALQGKGGGSWAVAGRESSLLQDAASKVPAGAVPSGTLAPTTAPPGARPPELQTAASAVGGDVYTALAPTRLLDTRSSGGPLGPGGHYTLTVAGGSDSVPSTASAVALNLTATDTTAAGYLSAYPAGGVQPTVSNLNWSAEETVANLAIIPIGSGGAVTFYNFAGSADLIVDLEGYFSSPLDGGAGEYQPLSPVRITDTRPGSGFPNQSSPLAAGSTLNVQVGGVDGVPSGATAAILNLTATDTTAQSYFTLYPSGSAQPLASNLDWVAGQTVANRVLVPLGADGGVTIYNHAGVADAVVDLDGYFTASGASGGLYYPLTPTRILDTRQSGGPLGSGTTREVALAGVGGIASDAVAVVSNVTAADTTASSYFTVYPGGASRPTASDLNWRAGQVAANLTAITLGSQGSAAVFNSSGDADLIIDAFGYFGPAQQQVLISPQNLSNGVTGLPYSATLEASGGTAPYQWSVTSGALPQGLELSPGGDISGTPGSPGSYSFVVQASDSSQPTPETGTQQMSLTVLENSTNWSGYAEEGGPFSSVSGTFTVPTLYNTDPAGAYMAEWVGIDGATSQDTNLIQAGIQETIDPDNSAYFSITPWWEVLPAPETDISGFAVSAGDSITVSITQISGENWVISLENQTTDQSFSTEQTYQGAGETAEWIVEAPRVNDQQTMLAGYSQTEFSGLTAQGTQSGALGIEMVQEGEEVSTPSALDSTGFNVASGDQAPASP